MSLQKDNVVIEFVNVSKFYHTYAKPHHRFLELISREDKTYAHETRALDNVSFSLKRGGRLGIVGENGSGKSTLLKILAGVLTPTNGAVRVNGRVSALLELGAGFNPELSGLENIYQYCMLHGMNKDEIERAVPEIIQFSELRKAIEHPVKTYSSGMTVRLSFSCAVYVQPDILIVDEALSVGDTYFQNKCLHKIRSMLDDDTAFIYVTHAADAIRSLCEDGLWLERGKVLLSGDAVDVGAAYQKNVFSKMVKENIQVELEGSDELSPEENLDSSLKVFDGVRQEVFADRVEPLRTGSGEIKILDIELIDEHGNETDTILFEKDAHIRVFFKIHEVVLGNIAITLGVYGNNGVQILHFNSLVHGININELSSKNTYVIDFKFKCFLIPNEYSLAAGVSEMDESVLGKAQMITANVIDYCIGGARFSVQHPISTKGKDLWGLCYSDCNVNLKKIS